MRKAWRVIGMTVAAGMLTASAAACGAGSGGDAPANGLILYSGQHEQTTQALVSAFEKQTGIKVTVRNGDEDHARRADHAGGFPVASVTSSTPRTPRP